MKQHGLNSEAKASFLEMFEQVTDDRRWMAAVWCVEDGKVEIKRITTMEFPIGDMLPAVGVLAVKLHETNMELASPPKPKPLEKVFPKQWTPDGDVPTHDEEAKQESEVVSMPANKDAVVPNAVMEVVDLEGPEEGSE